MFAVCIVAALVGLAVTSFALFQPSLATRVRWPLLVIALSASLVGTRATDVAIDRERADANRRVFDVCLELKASIVKYKLWMEYPNLRPKSFSAGDWWLETVVLRMHNGWNKCMRSPVVCDFPYGARTPGEGQIAALDTLIRAFETQDSCAPCTAYTDRYTRPRGCP